MNPQERIQVNRLVSILEAFKSTGGTMPLQQAVSFVHVAMEPGLGVTALARATGVNLGSTSRHVRALAGLGHGAHIPALVTLDFERDDRTKALYLTDAGQALMVTVLSALEGTTQAGKRDHETPVYVIPARVAWNPFGRC